MGRNFKIFLTLFISVCLYSIYLFGIPAIVNLPKRAELVQNILKEQTGMTVELVKPELQMGYLPSVKISAQEFNILNDDNSKALNVKNPYLCIKLLPLIFKNIVIQDFSADSINADIVYDGKFKLGQYYIDDMPQSELKLSKAQVMLDKYDLKLNDKVQNKTIIFDGKYLKINKFADNKRLSLSTSAAIITGNKISHIDYDIDLKLPLKNVLNNQLRLSGQIKDLDISDFSEYIKTLSKNEIKSTSGIINVQFTTQKNSYNNDVINLFADIQNLAIMRENIKTSIYSDERLKIEGSFSTINNGININDFKISTKDIEMFLQGQVTKLNAKLPQLDLKVGVMKSKAEKILALLPASHDLVPDIDLYVLKEAGFWGDASAYLEVKGKADYPNVFGSVLVKNAYMVQPIPNSEKATIKLAFKGDKFDLDIKVPTSPTQTVWVKGPISIDKDETADLLITSTDDVDLKTAQIVLNPLHRTLHFDLGPVPIMDIKGKGGINLRVTGTQKNPYAWGRFFFNDATVSFLDVKELEVNHGFGDLIFDNQNTVFRTQSAVLNGQPISIKGTCTLLGEFDFNAASENQDIGKLLRTVQISPMLKDIQNLVKNFESASGLADIKFNLKGHVKDINDIVFNKNIFANGTIKMLSDNIKLKDIPITVSNTKGVVNFNNLNTNFKLSSELKNSKLELEGKINDNNCNAKITSNKFNLKDGADALNLNIPFKKDLAHISSSFTAQYSGKLDDIEYNKVNLKGKLYSNKGAKSDIILNNDADFELNNSNFKLSNLKGSIKSSPFNISANASKIFSKNPIINANGKLSEFDLTILNNEEIQKLLPNEIKDVVFISGKPDISARIRNNNMNLYLPLDDISLIYKPTDTKLTINSGAALVQNTTLNLNKINAIADNMPIFADGKIYNINTNPNLNLYLNFKPNQEIFDKIYNKKSIYPIKIKGDVIVSSKLNGTVDNLLSKSTIDISENSNLYYMGATIGDINNPVKITIDSIIQPNRYKINNLQYDKIILSQNNKPFINTQLNASGTVTVLEDNNAAFNNFRIKTKNPTDAKIFNIIFRKPFMKQGVFTSDIILNGTSLYPKILGTLNITSIDIPFFDSKIQDIVLNFKNDKIFIGAKGTVLTNNIFLDAVMQNKISAPYILNSIKLKLADLDVNRITNTLNDIEAEAARNLSSSQNVQQFDINDLIIKKGVIQADKIKVRNIDADNFSAEFKITDKSILNIDKFNFDIAQGSVLGKFNYNLKNKNIYLDINLQNANAQIMSEALFDLKGQIFGSIYGDFRLSCKAECLETLSGEGKFDIKDGRMPKLGSLEYLLKAGNLFKTGFTALSINSLADLVTPLKTGEFKNIYGNVHLTDGIADDINVYSSGNDLNMYMKGNYNLSSSIAQMKIFGGLSKNITNMSGKIKNASLNTLFNTIPGINDSKEKLLLESDISKIPNIKDATNVYRIFTVDVEGDINGNNYVRSFKWVK